MKNEQEERIFELNMWSSRNFHCPSMQGDSVNTISYFSYALKLIETLFHKLSPVSEKIEK